MSVHSLAIVQSLVVIAALSRRDDCLPPTSHPFRPIAAFQCNAWRSQGANSQKLNGAPTAGHLPKAFINASGRGSQFESSMVAGASARSHAYAHLPESGSLGRFFGR